ncbi:glycosyltransferase family protein [Acetobacter tropicalis]|uniref:Membrane protein 6-pyruvoyl-tetrahydropterin synthase-related domain-containing protein n=1 Tax=Acetobacter tropicalis TaxID=104102 RepID=A0A252ADS2_9PROT|nr:hypothetical protein [Acetobacter tropicalis]OUI87758.1 hypothetical protein HC62_05080 [Acetobacter tropicalis]
MRFLKNINVYFYFFIFSIVIVAAATLNNPYFFTEDDSQNEYLGFMRQYGESWRNWEIPFIAKNILVGSNAMVELQRAIFAPHNIVASLITSSNTPVTSTGVFFAVLDIFVLAVAGYIIGQSLGLKKNISVLLGFSLPANAMFLYQYAGPWWNAANGHALAMLSVASFFFLLKKRSLRSYVFNFISVFLLLLSGWPHGFIGYLVIGVCSLAFVMRQNFKKNIALVVPTLCAGLCAVPVYSEFLYLRDFIVRPSGWDNLNNFLVPSLTQMLFAFSPTYFEHMNYFGGYRAVCVAFGFASVFCIFPVFFSKIKLNDPVLKILFTCSVVFLILCQMPSQSGMLRYSIRFLPFFTLMVNVISFYILDRFEIVVTKGRERAFFYFLIVSAIISYSICAFEFKNLLMADFFSLVLVLCAYLFFIKKQAIKTETSLPLFVVPLASVLIMFFTLSGVGEKYMYQIDLPKKIENLSNLNLSGSVMSFSGWGYHDAHELADINSSQFGYYDVKTANGYSPNGQKYIDQVLVHSLPHTLLDQNASLPQLTQQIPEFGNQCLLSMFGVSTIVLGNGNMLDAVKRCGFGRVLPAPRGMMYAMSQKTYSSSLAYASAPAVSVSKETNNTIKLAIPDEKNAITMVFSREFWPGYSAHGLACKVDVSGYRKMLLSVTVPPHCQGELTVSYFPKTWKYTLFSPLLGLILFGVFLWCERQQAGKPVSGLQVQVA